MAWLNVVKLAWMTGAMLIVPGIVITGPLAFFATKASQHGDRPVQMPWRTYRTVLLPLVPVVALWIWAAVFARVNQHEALVPWQTQGVLALAALALVIAIALLILYRREWRHVAALLVLLAWVAMVACVAGLWAVQGWPPL